ncbi:conserved hypothetical protein [Ricinus communis]|uniref:RNase H type-1 domain-containing protein n=1 Tax=Ricinus communis TaxID=3988 RepID=B9S4Q0_RICCO|nr:conserved hypothetical protein [Ricinus communis]
MVLLMLKSSIASITTICHDHIGKLIDGHSTRIRCSTPLVVEAMALLKAITLAKSLSLSHILFEKDSKSSPTASLNTLQPRYEMK